MLLILFFVVNASAAFSQSTKTDIIKGNDAYKKRQYNEAAGAYQKALKKSPDATAFYNLGNAFYKTNRPDQALQAYDNTAKLSANNAMRQKAYYNGGVVLQSQKKLPECIKAYKNALKLDAADEDARQNLERALQQQKQQQQQQNKKQDNKDQKDQNKKEEPKPEPSRISKQDAEEKLKSLLEHEKDLQEKMHKVKSNAADKPKKDW